MGLHTVVGRLANGSFVAIGNAPGPTVSSGLATPRFRLVVMRAALDSGAAVGEYDGDDLFFAPTPSGGQTFGAPPFARVTRVLVGSERFYVTRSDRLEIRGFDPNGILRTILRSVRNPQPIRRADITRAVDSAVKANGGGREAETEKASQYQTMPAFRDIVLDRQGGFWVRAFQPGASAARWNIVSVDGSVLGSIDLPVSASIMDVSNDRLLLLTRDSDGVERVELRKVIKGR